MSIFVSYIILTFFAMEGVAWFMHKYLMHGALWYLHADHHKREHLNTILERNDTFFVFFAILSMLSFLSWQVFDSRLGLAIGIGICVYGLAYFIVHDLFIHQRIKIMRNTKNPYLRAIRRAHKMHHKHLDKHDGECFGMLWVPLKYYKDELKR